MRLLARIMRITSQNLGGNMFIFFRKYMVFVIAAMLIGACAAPPSLKSGQADSTYSYDDRIREGISTKQDVRAIFGEPTLVSQGTMGPDFVVWVYQGSNNQLQFAFNQRGIVTYKCLMSSTPGQVSMRKSNQCIAGSESGGVICGQPAAIIDHQRGGMVCEKHAPGKGQ